MNIVRDIKVLSDDKFVTPNTKGRELVITSKGLGHYEGSNRTFEVCSFLRSRGHVKPKARLGNVDIRRMEEPTIAPGCDVEKYLVRIFSYKKVN